MNNPIPLKFSQFTYILLAILLLLQLAIWFGQGSIFSLLYTYYEQYRIIETNEALKASNLVLANKIIALKQGNNEIEARARLELGLVQKNETYYQVVYRHQEEKPWSN